ncbi:unnamed protein product [Oncorhynchus mykiss]|uniref:RanBP2-type domain-containing protein n=1 Tax=Oncorhynchus mykiss TaxID=8022 RepID=A0A060W8X7_ONCMY|nr:unnamed protein product [Oncorhynchus mykiss]
MGDKKSPTRPKRQAKPSADDGYWDCSVCTFKNSAEAFKCSICDVRKGTSTRRGVSSAGCDGWWRGGGRRRRRVHSAKSLLGDDRMEHIITQERKRWAGPHTCCLPPQLSLWITTLPTKDGSSRVTGSSRLWQTETNTGERNLRKPRINSQLVAQQVAQQYATPPPPKKERKERPEREHDPDRELVDVEGEHHEGVRPERVRPDEEESPLDNGRKEIPDNDKAEKVKEISLARPITKKSSIKKIRSTDIHQSPPSDKHSVQSGKSTTKTNNSHISRPKLKNIDRSTAQQLAITVGNVTVIITDFKEKTRSSSTSSSTVTSSAGSEQQHQSSGSESMDKSSTRTSTPKGELSVGQDESF